MGTGFAVLLMAIGAFRELVATAWLLAILPPGAFFSLALAIAAKNVIDRRRQDKRANAGSQRPRYFKRRVR
jgi:Na+-translocating ferredoxin:NAD+ oxidoreductase RnfE subunit